MTKTPRWLRSVLDASDEAAPQMTYERENRPTLEHRRDEETQPRKRRARA